MGPVLFLFGFFFVSGAYTKTKKRFQFTVKKLLWSVSNVLSDKIHFFPPENWSGRRKMF